MELARISQPDALAALKEAEYDVDDAVELARANPK